MPRSNFSMTGYIALCSAVPAAISAILKWPLKRAVSGLIAMLLCAAAAAQPVEGKDFLVLNPPQAVEPSGKVEVTEFFWYRCPHCYNLEPTLQEWVKKLPRDVQFRRVPAVFNEDWALDARVFYTLETTGDLARVHTALMNAIHRDGGNRTRGDAYLKWVADWLSKNGVDMAKYDSTLRSFTVETKLKRAVQLTQAYKLDGVPAISVQGRWLVSASLVGTPQAMISITDQLTGEARRQLTTK